MREVLCRGATSKTQNANKYNVRVVLVSDERQLLFADAESRQFDEALDNFFQLRGGPPGAAAPAPSFLQLPSAAAAAAAPKEPSSFLLCFSTLLFYSTTATSHLSNLSSTLSL